MNNCNEAIKEILKVFKNNHSFFITSHARSDGDSIGSQLALASFLKNMGKLVCVANIDKVPLIYGFLKGSEDIEITQRIDNDYDVAVYLDCSCLLRTENIFNPSKHAKLLVNIDHHMDNELFGNYNYVEKNASSTSEIIYNIMISSHYEINKDEAACLYVGILTDTGKFQESNTSAESHIIVADLLRKSISANEIGEKVYRSFSFNCMKLLEKVLQTLEIYHDGHVAILVITQNMYKETGSTAEDTEGIVDYARNIKGVEIGILFRETAVSKQFKISLRSKRDIDVNKVAKIFDGGGHRNAAGCVITGEILDVKQKMLKAIAEVMGKS